MPPGEVEIDGGVIERSMAEQHVNGAQVRSCFEQVGSCFAFSKTFPMPTEANFPPSV